MSELRRYWWINGEMREAKHVPEAGIGGGWAIYDSALAAIEEARREAGKKERERIYNEVGAMATVVSGPAITFSLILDAIRGAKAEKVCEAPAKPPTIEAVLEKVRFDPQNFTLTESAAFRTINTLVDVVNSLREELRRRAT